MLSKTHADADHRKEGIVSKSQESYTSNSVHKHDAKRYKGATKTDFPLFTAPHEVK